MRGDSRAKLTKIIDTTAIDSVCVALGLDHERIRAMNDGTGEIDAESAAWIDSEVLRLEAAGLLEVTETPQPEGIGSDDATPTAAETAELTVPEAGPHDVADPREALRAMVEGVRDQAIAIVIDEGFSKYEKALADVLWRRLALQLHFRRPLSTGGDTGEESAADRERSIGLMTARLRGAEKQLKKSLGLFHWLRKPRDLSGGELYHRLIRSWCEAREDMEAGAELAQREGLTGIGRFLYPESYGNTTRQCRRLDEGKRRDAAALIEAIRLAEEAKFRSPLPCEEALAALEIKLCMELMLIMELGVDPSPYHVEESVLDHPGTPEAMRRRQSMVKTRLGRLEWLDGRQRKCRKYKGRQTAAAFFRQLIDESGAEECRRLAWIMTLDMQELGQDFVAGKGPKGFFNFPADVQPGPDN